MILEGEDINIACRMQVIAGQIFRQGTVNKGDVFIVSAGKVYRYIKPCRHGNGGFRLMQCGGKILMGQTEILGKEIIFSDDKTCGHAAKDMLLPNFLGMLGIQAQALAAIA